MQRTHGFTLIELLVVVALLGIIIGAVLVNMNSAKRKAYDTVAMSCAQDIARKQKIVQTRDQTYQPFALLPDMTVCRTLVELNATPTGSAEELRFAYEARHPKGGTTYTVTDSEIYENGVSRTGAQLSSDPAAPLVLAGGGGPVSGGGGTGTGLDACVRSRGGGSGTYVQGTLDSGGITLTDAVLEDDVVVPVSVEQYTRLSHDVIARRAQHVPSGEQFYAVYAFLNMADGVVAQDVPTAPSAAAINIPGEGVISAAQWESLLLSTRGWEAPDPAEDRAQNYFDAIYGPDDGSGHCAAPPPI